jgi:hypothetical protein
MIKTAHKCLVVILLITFFTLSYGCVDQKEPVHTLTREKAIPGDAVKASPETDVYRPVADSDEWNKPVPMAGPINTAGAEDSPYITPDGNTLYFFFTPNVSVPPEKQLIDGLTGIWCAHKINGTWTEPERIILNHDVSLDGCVCVQGDTMWFGSVRAGNIGTIDVYTAMYRNGKWTDWKNAGEQLNKQYDIGEFQVTPDGNTIYFGRSKQGTDNTSLWASNRSIWESEKVNGIWQEPVELGPNVNCGMLQDQPFLTSDGNELWYTGESRLGYAGPAIFRCVRSQNGEWGKAEEIVSNFAGEPTLDGRGNIYFVHHYYSKDGRMLEADIYVAYRK